jgi:hypothetical protein
MTTYQWRREMLGETPPTAEELERLAGRVLFDEQFRADFFADPAGTAAQINVYLTQEQIELVKSLNVEDMEEYANGVTAAIGQSHVLAWIG